MRYDGLFLNFSLNSIQDKFYGDMGHGCDMGRCNSLWNAGI